MKTPSYLELNSMWYDFTSMILLFLGNADHRVGFRWSLMMYELLNPRLRTLLVFSAVLLRNLCLEWAWIIIPYFRGDPTCPGVKTSTKQRPSVRAPWVFLNFPLIGYGWGPCIGRSHGSSIRSASALMALMMLLAGVPWYQLKGFGFNGFVQVDALLMNKPIVDRFSSSAKDREPVAC